MNKQLQRFNTHYTPCIIPAVFLPAILTNNNNFVREFFETLSHLCVNILRRFEKITHRRGIAVSRYSRILHCATARRQSARAIHNRNHRRTYSVSVTAVK